MLDPLSGKFYTKFEACTITNLQLASLDANEARFDVDIVEMGHRIKVTYPKYFIVMIKTPPGDNFGNAEAQTATACLSAHDKAENSATRPRMNCMGVTPAEFATFHNLKSSFGCFMAKKRHEDL